MQFFIADTFTDSLARLNAQEQKSVKTKAFDLQMDPANPGMKLHRIERAREPDFWSVRVSRDLRIIIHRKGGAFLLCYAGHHDDAYRWAERRKIEIHPRTGAAQIVEIRQKIREVVETRHVKREMPSGYQEAGAGPGILDHVSEETLLEYGVPGEWIGEVRGADEETLLEIAEHLPQEAAEALLNLAVGIVPEKPAASAAAENPYEHPDAARRFRLVTDIDELKQALEYPWEKWTIFLHPAQRQIVEREFNGPARVSGSAGTGKTIVALHRAVHLAKNNPAARVLLTTFSAPLAHALEQKLRILAGSKPGLMEQIEVLALNEIGLRLYSRHFERPEIVSGLDISRIAAQAVDRCTETSFSLDFVIDEWKKVVDAWGINSWEQYRDVRRLGRRKRLSEKQRRQLWSVFEQINQMLDTRGLCTWNRIFGKLAELVREKGLQPFDFVIVDEAQDISVSQLGFLAVLGAGRPDCLFFAGDIGQRIFQQPFSWKAMGVDIRGRSNILKINYRTSHQIRRCADRLLPAEIQDIDGNREDRRGTVSVFNGPDPDILIADSVEDEQAAVAAWLEKIAGFGVEPHEIGLFVRSEGETERATRAVEKAGLQPELLDEKIDIKKGRVSVGTMHLAKGLEFKAVAVMACDDMVIPLQGRIEAVADENELEQVYASERHLLYVACTRARDYLFLSGVDPASEFLEDMQAN